jgi:abhydrolase domain-containing protein 17
MGNTIGKFVFMPPETSYNEEKPFKVTWLTTKNNKKIPAYHLKNKYNKTTILYSHGNAADIGGMYPFLEFLHKNLDVFYNIMLG